MVDPPYNLTKTYAGRVFQRRSAAAYAAWVEEWLPLVERALVPEGSLYVCADWRMGGVLQPALESRFVVRNRITWEREKGRGALANWKNASEDIWFCTRSRTRYHFDVQGVKMRRRVLAPYRAAGRPKDWEETPSGRFRLTHPSNLWTDLVVPFWSMPENTDHPAQKPEKLVAKLVLASSRPGDVVLDPFLGSGTTAVVARKLGRRFVGIEMEEAYACLALRRLELAERSPAIQGMESGVFWERNSSPA